MGIVASSQCRICYKAVDVPDVGLDCFCDFLLFPLEGFDFGLDGAVEDGSLSFFESLLRAAAFFAFELNDFFVAGALVVAPRGPFFAVVLRAVSCC